VVKVENISQKYDVLLILNCKQCPSLLFMVGNICFVTLIQKRAYLSVGTA